MSANTPAKRRALISLGHPWGIPFAPYPAGSVTDAERLYWDGLYSFATPLPLNNNLINATYVVTKRYIPGPNQWVYYSERFDDRNWQTVEDVWCLDCALAYSIYAPTATLTFDANSLVVGASSVFKTDNPVFTASSVGNFLRAYGGIAVITAYTSTTQVTATINQAFAGTLEGEPGDLPFPAISGNWTIGVPTTKVYGLNHLEGCTVTALADGAVVTDLLVTDGTITLPQAATMITIGLPYTVQLQTLPLEISGGPTLQGKRKNIPAVTVRLEQSRGMEVGSNQVDFSAYPTGTTQEWGSGLGITNLVAVKERSAQVDAGNAVPLFTGDERVNIPGTWRKPAQIAIQQTNPLPLNVLAAIPEIVVGDDNG